MTLLGRVLSALVERTGLDASRIDDVIGGCVSQYAEQSANVVRAAVLDAGFPESVPAVTVDRQCGSSQQAVHFAAQAVMAGCCDVVIACGVESMSRVPMFSNTGCGSPWHGILLERYPQGIIQQGLAAELVSARWQLGRDELDSYAAHSHRRAAAATQRDSFGREIVAVNGCATDETIRPGTTREALAALPAAFYTEEDAGRYPEARWVITAGNSSPLSDGASAVLIASPQAAASLGLVPRARVHAMAVAAADPIEMLTAVVPATEQVLRRGGLGIDDLDAYEVNEAFAPVPLLWLRATGADPERLNQFGGAIALGHPLGASGTKLLTTLLTRLESAGGRYGLQTMCEAGGMANATIIERI